VVELQMGVMAAVLASEEVLLLMLVLPVEVMVVTVVRIQAVVEVVLTQERQEVVVQELSLSQYPIKEFT